MSLFLTPKLYVEVPGKVNILKPGATALFLGPFTFPTDPRLLGSDTAVLGTMSDILLSSKKVPNCAQSLGNQQKNSLLCFRLLLKF
jgi:hypothetical protein